MRAVVAVYDDGNKVAFSKRTFLLLDEMDVEQKSEEDIKYFLLDQLYELEERVD